MARAMNIERPTRRRAGAPVAGAKKKTRPRSCRGRIEGASKLVSDQTRAASRFGTSERRASRSLIVARTFKPSHSPFPGASAVASVS